MDQAIALKRRAQEERNTGRLEQARLLYEQAAALEREAGDAAALAHTLRHVADVHRAQEHPELALPLYRETLAIYRARPDTAPLELANTLRGLALVTGDDETWREARDLYRQAGVEAGVEECTRRLAPR
jgi:tetratricopeptide (TPR) repeat protein